MAGLIGIRHRAGRWLLLIVVVPATAPAALTCPPGTVEARERTAQMLEVWCETTAQPARMHGPYRAWWPNGTLGSSGQHVMGRPDGEWLAWDAAGRQVAVQVFRDGRLVAERRAP